MVKVVKLKINKPIDMDWKKFGSILNELRYETCKIKNMTIQKCWEWNNFSSEYCKKNDDTYPKPEDIVTYKSFAGYINKEVRSVFYKNNSGNCSCNINSAYDKYYSKIKELLPCKISMINFKINTPILLHNKNLKINLNNGKYELTLSLLSNEYKKELDLKKGQISVRLEKVKSYQKAILNRCLDGTYKIAESQIIKAKDNHWYVYLSYKFENTKVVNKMSNILGIDMGIKYPVYMAVYNTKLREYINGGEITRFRKQVERRKRDLQQQGKYCGNGRIGHGTKTRIKPMYISKNKIENFKNVTNHKYALFVVNYAIRNECGIINMEDLKGISANHTFLSNWSYYDLQQKIINKASEYGIKVFKIKPAYTSQKCSSCEYTDKENRLTQEKFKCLKCGLELNADYNAALNISNPYNEISDELSDDEL